MPPGMRRVHIPQAMLELNHQIRELYEAKSIAAEKAGIILARGRAAAAGEEPHDKNKVAVFSAPRAWSWRTVLSLAAALLVFAGVWGLVGAAGNVSPAVRGCSSAARRVSRKQPRIDPCSGGQGRGA